MPSLSPFPKTLALLESGREAGHHLGAQVFIRHRGEVVLDIGWGEAREEVPMTPETLLTWLSCSKPIVAAGIALLWERGLLDLDAPVMERVPECGAGGKERITTRHLLTHTCGFRSADSMWNRLSFEENVARACAAPLEDGWVVGETAGYQLSASWFILGELIQRVTGSVFAEWIREAVFLPLGMDDCWFAAPPEVYRAYGDRIGWLYNTALGRREPHLFRDSEAGYGMCWPGSSGRGPMRQLARFYEMMARGGAPLLAPETAALWIKPERVGRFDLTFQHTIDWSLGFILDSNHYGKTAPYGFGPHAGARTFGHSGAQSSCSFYDPDHELIVAWITNGMPGEPVHRRRARNLNAAIYEDLELGLELQHRADA